jgi:hypothetical protein
MLRKGARAALAGKNFGFHLSLAVGSSLAEFLIQESLFHGGSLNGFYARETLCGYLCA